MKKLSSTTVSDVYLELITQSFYALYHCTVASNILVFLG